MYLIRVWQSVWSHVLIRGHWDLQSDMMLHGWSLTVAVVSLLGYNTKKKPVCTRGGKGWRNMYDLR